MTGAITMEAWLDLISSDYVIQFRVRQSALYEVKDIDAVSALIDVINRGSGLEDRLNALIELGRLIERGSGRTVVTELVDVATPGEAIDVDSVVVEDAGQPVAPEDPEQEERTSMTRDTLARLDREMSRLRKSLR